MNLNISMLLLVASLGLTGCPGPSTTTPQETAPPSLHTIDFAQIARIPSASNSPSPAWSPSGARLAYTGDYVDKPSLRRQLWLYELGSDAPRMVYDPLESPNDYAIYRPAFLNETQVAVAQPFDDSNADDPPIVASLDGSAPPREMQHGGYALRPAGSDAVLINDYDSALLLRPGKDPLELRTHLSLFPWSDDHAHLLGWGFRSQPEPTSPHQEDVENWSQYFVEIERVSLDGQREVLTRWGVGRFGADAPSRPDNFQLRWAPNGADVLFVREDNEYPQGPFDPRRGFGELVLWEAATQNQRIIAPAARNPRVLPHTPYVLFDTPEGLSITDLQEVRHLPHLAVTEIQPSPDGTHIVGLAEGDDGFDLVIYAVR